MVKATYNKQVTAVLVIDPYNDFISEGAKYGSLKLKGVAEANNCVSNECRALMNDSRATAAVCTVNENIAHAGIKGMEFIRTQ